MYSIKNMKLSNVQKSVTTTVNVAENYNVATLNFLRAIQEQQDTDIVNMAKTIVDGNIPVNEAMDLYAMSTVSIIDSILNNMKKQIDIFDQQTRKYFKERKVFSDNLKELSDQTCKLNKAVMNIEGYFYTEMKQPNILLASEFKDKLQDLLNKDPGAVFNALNQNHQNAYMNRQRQNALNQSSAISNKEFRDKLFGFYRNNVTHETVVPYSQSAIEDMIRKYLDPQLYMDNIKELYMDIYNQANEVKRCLSVLCNGDCNKQDIIKVIRGESSRETNMFDETIPQGFNDALKAILKQKVRNVNEMMMMYSMILSDKLTAITNSITQNTILLDSFINYVSVEEGEI